jgi:hypothetical protein
MTADEELDQEDFIPLLQPRDTTERELARNLLDAAGIRNTLVDSDVLELRRVIAGDRGIGLQFIVIPKVELERAVGVLREAWGDAALEGRLPQP